MYKYKIDFDSIEYTNRVDLLNSEQYNSLEVENMIIECVKDIKKDNGDYYDFDIIVNSLCEKFRFIEPKENNSVSIYFKLGDELEYL